MATARSRPRAALVLLALLAAVAGPLFSQTTAQPAGQATGQTAGQSVGGSAPSPWDALDQARRSLAEAGSEQADFVQTYLPAGFSSGEEESGRIALRLPDCLRWDYAEPFPKSFLLCGDQVWSWNPADQRGQTGALDRESQPGLDLLLLPIEQLGTRYEAKIVPADQTGKGAPADGASRVTVHLTPRAEMAERTELTSATLVVDTATDRLVELSYQDQEGNRTRFALSAYRPIADKSLPDPFQAPDGITWEEMQ